MKSQIFHFILSRLKTNKKRIILLSCSRFNQPRALTLKPPLWELLRVGLPSVIPTRNRSMFWKDIAQHSKTYAVLEVQYFEALVTWFIFNARCMQILKTTRVSSYNLDFMIIGLVENILNRALQASSSAYCYCYTCTHYTFCCSFTQNIHSFTSTVETIRQIYVH